MSAAASQPSGSSGRRWRKSAVWAACLLLLVPALFHFREHLRAYAVLMHFSDPQASNLILRWGSKSIAISEVSVPIGGGSTPALLYSPQGVAHPPGIVMLHGIHHLAIHDPRFVNLARALAEAGFAVLTPTLTDLADYHVDGPSIPTIGESAQWLEARLGTGPVTLIGISFGGGLALLAAARPQYEQSVRAIAVIGGYEDLERVSRFLATSEEEFPDGRVVPLPAHDYGGAILVYDNLGQFFSPSDVPAAREALRRYLWEQPETARPWLEQLSPAGRAMMDDLFARRIDRVRPQLLAAIRADQKEFAALSPHGQIARLRVPVFLLHGSEDNVIPPAETLWLAKEVPREDLRAVLITPVFSHVDLKSRTSLWEELRLVHFLAGVLRAAD